MTIPLWERSSFSEAAMATVQATQLPTVPPPSQPRRGSTTPTSVMRLAQIPCGSGLAREGGVSVTESLTEPPLSQASQLPHGSCTTHKTCLAQIPCGSGLGPEGGGSG